MPIKIMLTECGAAPVVVCNVCGAWIERANDGGYAWNKERPESGALHEVAFVLKGRCFLAYEAEQALLHTTCRSRCSCLTWRQISTWTGKAQQGWRRITQFLSLHTVLKNEPG